MSERKLATIRVIDKLEPIEGADKILKATVGGWQLVTAKDNNFEEGQLVIYLEIDSWVPHAIAPFLSKGQDPREYNGVKGERLKTIKLRGQVSQGLIMPVIPEVWQSEGFAEYIDEHGTAVGFDATEVLGIQKWEKALSPQMQGVARGNFPSFIFKTDQERIQNLSREFEKYKAEGLTFEVTEKMEGSSMTVFRRSTAEAEEVDTGVCSRNMNLKEVEGNAFWIVARKYGLLDILERTGLNIALQGELIGPNVQGNIYGLKDYEFRLFDIFDIDTATYWTPAYRRSFAEMYNIPHSPVIYDNLTFKDTDTIATVLEWAENKSQLANVEREGIVFKCIEKPEISFKAISNKYLLKHGD